MTADIDQLLTTWVAAERTGDAEALASLLTDDFVGIGPVGFVLDRAAWLARFDQGLEYEQLDLEEVSIRHHGDVGLVVAHQRAVGSHAGNPIPPDSRVSLTALPDGDGLRIAGAHYSFIGPPLGPGR